MPWEEKTVMETRGRFIQEVKAKEISFSQLCARYGISRKTGYKWLSRYNAGEDLADRSRRPFHVYNRTPPEVEALVLELRDKHPAWGARKLKRRLENLGHDGIPAASTISDILKRNGRISLEESKRRQPVQRFEKSSPNELWQMDFKGYFRLLDSTICHPLTMLDDHSRHSLCLEAKDNQRGVGVKASLTRVFKEYGLPQAILCDNGAPWGDNHQSISSIDTWLMQLNVLPIHIRPYHPQTQGKEERFHLTMEKELDLRSLRDILHAQEVFDQWREIYNHQRPHQALDYDVPASRYTNSKIAFPSCLHEPEYPTGAIIKRVDANGIMRFGGYEYSISKSLSKKHLEVVERDDGFHELRYGAFRVALIDTFDHIVEQVKIRRATL